MNLKKYLLAIVAALSLGLSIENGLSAAQAQGNGGGNVNPAPQQQGQFVPDVEIVNDAEGKYIIIALNGRSYRLQFRNKSKCWSYIKSIKNKSDTNWQNIETAEILHNFLDKEINTNSLVLKIIKYMLDIQNGIPGNEKGEYSINARHIVDSGHMGYIPFPPSLLSEKNKYQKDYAIIGRINWNIQNSYFSINKTSNYYKEYDDFIRSFNRNRMGLRSIKKSKNLYNIVYQSFCKEAYELVNNITTISNVETIDEKNEKIEINLKLNNYQIKYYSRYYREHISITPYTFVGDKKIRTTKMKLIVVINNMKKQPKTIKVITCYPYQ